VSPQESAVSWKWNSRSLGVMLEKSKASYSHRFGLSIQFDSHTKSNSFTFTPRPEVLEGIRASAPAPPTADVSLDSKTATDKVGAL
jgi:hypothetical protein